MQRRFVTIWFRHLLTDWFSRHEPSLKNIPFVLRAPDHGRMIVTATNAAAEAQGLYRGMSLADARAVVPKLIVKDDIADLPARLLKAVGLWMIRYTPITAIDLPSGLILDVSGCAHLWGGENSYVKEIISRLTDRGYDVRAGMADTIGMAWAAARFGNAVVIPSGEQMNALLPMPAESLRLEPDVLERLHKLGLHQVGSFMHLPRTALRRRFSKHLLLRLDQALGLEEEIIEPLVPMVPYQERLPCLEPIVTATGIEIALERLLQMLCKRLLQEGKGIRTAMLSCYRVDGKLSQIEIGTSYPSHNVAHLFKLFALKIQQIEPDLGIELFLLEAGKVENAVPQQSKFWGNGGSDEAAIAELVDRLTGKLGTDTVRRFLPAEHHWPERSFILANNFQEQPASVWPSHRPRPICLLPKPELIEVSAPIPDYPPMLFHYRGQLHRIKKADGPERIEREWWLDEGEHRDYYVVEDEQGARYWVFRHGHYDTTKPRNWYLHGFFA